MPTAAMTRGSSSDPHKRKKVRRSLKPLANRRVHDTPELLERIFSFLTMEQNRTELAWILEILAQSSKRCWEQVARTSYKEISWTDYEYLTTAKHFGRSMRLNCVQGVQTTEADFRAKKLLSRFTPCNLSTAKLNCPKLSYVKSGQDLKTGNEVEVEFLPDGTRTIKWSYTAVVSTSGAVKGYKVKPPGSSKWPNWSVELTTNLLFKAPKRRGGHVAQLEAFLKWFTDCGCPAVSRIDMGCAIINLAYVGKIIEKMSEAWSEIGFTSTSSPLKALQAHTFGYEIQEFEDFATKVAPISPNIQSIALAYDPFLGMELCHRLGFSQLPRILDLIASHFLQVHDFNILFLWCNRSKDLKNLYRRPVPLACGRRLSSISISFMFWDSARMRRFISHPVYELDDGAKFVSKTKLLFPVARWLLSYCAPGALVRCPDSNELHLIVQYLHGLPLAAQDYIRATHFWTVKLDSFTDIKAHFGNSQLWSASNNSKSASIDSSGSNGTV